MAAAPGQDEESEPEEGHASGWAMHARGTFKRSARDEASPNRT